MQSLRFEENGNLYPYEAIITDLSTFKVFFVDNFPHSITRRELYANYLRYNSELKNLLGIDFIQWINGSFVTTKENPNDIDFVSFIPHEIMEKYEQELDEFWSFSLENKGLDAYLLATYSADHSFYPAVEIQKTRWITRFSYTKPEQNTMVLNKGFIQIIID